VWGSSGLWFIRYIVACSYAGSKRGGLNAVPVESFGFLFVGLAGLCQQATFIDRIDELESGVWHIIL
jgi:hypothetical protein